MGNNKQMSLQFEKIKTVLCGYSKCILLFILSIEISSYGQETDIKEKIRRINHDRSAIEDLTRIGDKAIPFLMEAYHKKEHPDIIAYALVKIGLQHKESMHNLFEVLLDEDAVRMDVLARIIHKH